ncbi:ketopantoate reductase family protein [Brevibacillus halotolerans]|uniref:ketopantoate reductase family protein n=1 Tax=Brevibacillus TaxID=55080 RepID=UPI00215C4007|nr:MULTISPECIES: ketopantoate reductase family protein [Brevibacillus]MCR8964302.1 ketopantoate reductase family protein [Brevibacillus laterosporus]MCZ0836457.1 ketopantoate reductase family protein [Brevibacillus halotolerans]
MRILMVGAGAIGGYFGCRLVESGRDVTFLVRQKRKEQLEERGLVIQSVNGDSTVQPALLVAGEEAPPFDVIMLSPKAYHLEDVINDITPYVGEDTMIIPLLNGIAHMQPLQEHFGAEKVLGGLCFIETTLSADGDIVQTSKAHRLVFGEWNGGTSERVERLYEYVKGANASFELSHNIQREAWQKYLFITMLSGITTLMNSAVGPIRDSPFGIELTKQVTEECVRIMMAIGAPISADMVDRVMETFKQQGYKMKSSMLRDMEKRLPIEGEHLQGYLLRLAEQQGIETPMLRIVYNNVRIYEQKRQSTF